MEGDKVHTQGSHSSEDVILPPLHLAIPQVLLGNPIQFTSPQSQSKKLTAAPHIMIMKEQFPHIFHSFFLLAHYIYQDVVHIMFIILIFIIFDTIQCLRICHRVLLLLNRVLIPRFPLRIIVVNEIVMATVHVGRMNIDKLFIMFIQIADIMNE